MLSVLKTELPLLLLLNGVEARCSAMCLPLDPLVCRLTEMLVVTFSQARRLKWKAPAVAGVFSP